MCKYLLSIEGTYERTLLISNVNPEIGSLLHQTKKVTQIQFTGWSDFAGQQQTKGLLGLLETLRYHQNKLEQELGKTR